MGDTTSRLWGGGNWASAGPNDINGMGALSVQQMMGMPAGSLPSLDLGGVTANGLDFSKLAGAQSGVGAGLGANIPTAQLALGGLGALGNLWGAFQAQGLAQKQFELTRNIANTNLTNQIRSYNTALEDRARSRGAAEGQSQSQVDDYLARNRMTR